MTIKTNSKTQPYILDLSKTLLDRGLNPAAMTIKTNSKTLLDRGLNPAAMTGEACLAPTIHSIFPTSYFTLLTSHFLLHTSYFTLPTSHFLLHTSYFTLASFPISLYNLETQ